MVLPESFRSHTTCASVGISNLTSYQINFPLTTHYGSTYQGGVFMPLFSSLPLGKVQTSIKHVVISFTGSSSDADNIFCLSLKSSQNYVSEMSKGGSSIDDFLVVVPWFGNYSVSGEYWSGDPKAASDVSVFWTSSSWMSGIDNSKPPSAYTSSFDIIDDLILYFSNKNMFPSLRSCVLSGYSAGGQFVNRYSWATSVDLSTSLSLRYIASNPGTYLYLSPHRPNSECLPNYNNGIFTCSQFEIPKNTSACSEYDLWKYGIGSFKTTSYRYFSKWATDDSDALVLSQTSSMLSKDIMYLLGDADYCNCNTPNYVNSDSCFPKNTNCYPNNYGGKDCCDTYPDSVNNLMNVECEANLQGNNRFQRGLNYMSYLQKINQYLNLSFSAKLPFYAIEPNMAHNHTAFYFSKTYSNWAYNFTTESNETKTNDNKNNSFNKEFLGLLALLLIIPSLIFSYYLYKRNSRLNEDNFLMGDEDGLLDQSKPKSKSKSKAVEM